jgi:hypothetical protein
MQKIFVALVMLPLFGWQLFNCLRTMEVRLRGGTTIYRHERPRLFWVLVGINCWGIFFAVAALFYLPNW